MARGSGTLRRSLSWAGTSDRFDRVGRKESPPPDDEGLSPLTPSAVWLSDTDLRVSNGFRGIPRRRVTLSALTSPLEALDVTPSSSSKNGRKRPPGGLSQIPPDFLLERVGFMPSRSDPRLEFFQDGLQGMRPYMEDRTLVVPRLSGKEDIALFAVFDGHGGAEVASLATELLPRILVASLARCRQPHAALRESFLELDQELRRSQCRVAHGFDAVGCTANVVVVLRRAGRLRLLCANCGDSRAVLSRGGVAVELSHDHTPLDLLEKRRIEAAGGNVIVYGTTGRVDGSLAVSRALGDFKFKENFDLPPERQKVTAMPDINETPVGSCDDFVAIGSDGVFDVFSSEELVSALGASRRAGQPWEKAIRSVLDKAVSGGDNVSLCVAQLVHSDTM